jgi:16S rRNA (cytosine1402-N4)-methyltransferase
MADNELDESHSGIDDRRGGPLAYATDYHAPVLCKAVVDGLIWNRHGLYVDGTLGGGGHTAAILDALASDGRVLGIDQDPEAVAEAGARLRSAVESGRLRILPGNFSEMKRLISETGATQVDGILLDLGVSSHQLDAATRGFSYGGEGELDMRMDTHAPLAADDVVNTWPEQELRDLLFTFGEEPRRKQIARQIVGARPLVTTRDLAEVVRGTVPEREAVKTLSRVFQAIRIAVNRELEALEQALRDTVDLLRERGRIAVISYHSLEDRRVKRFLRHGNFEGTPRRDLYGNRITPWREVTRHPIRPEEDELERNPRARSARLRIAERTGD